MCYLDKATMRTSANFDLDMSSSVVDGSCCFRGRLIQSFVASLIRCIAT